MVTLTTHQPEKNCGQFFPLTHLFLKDSVTRLVDLLHFGQLFKVCGNNYFVQITHTLGNFLRCQNLSFF